MNTSTETILKEANQIILTALTKALRDQGHYLSGALERSLTSSITKDRLVGSSLYYLWILDQGVAPGKMVIGTKSVTALTNYVQRRMGYDSKKAKHIAFAILKKQQNEGMSTRNAYRYSSTGQRKFALTQTFKNMDQLLSKQIFSGVDALIDNEFNKQKTATL